MTPLHAPAMRLLKRDGFVRLQITPDGNVSERYVLTETDAEQLSALLVYFYNHISDGLDLPDLQKSQIKS